MCTYIYIYICTYIYIHIREPASEAAAAPRARRAAGKGPPGGIARATVDFRNLIVFLLGRDPGILKSDIVSKKHPQLFVRI